MLSEDHLADLLLHRTFPGLKRVRADRIREIGSLEEFVNEHLQARDTGGVVPGALDPMANSVERTFLARDRLAPREDSLKHFDRKSGQV